MWLKYVLLSIFSINILSTAELCWGRGQSIGQFEITTIGEPISIISDGTFNDRSFTKKQYLNGTYMTTIDLQPFDFSQNVTIKTSNGNKTCQVNLKPRLFDIHDKQLSIPTSGGNLTISGWHWGNYKTNIITATVKSSENVINPVSSSSQKDVGLLILIPPGAGRFLATATLLGVSLSQYYQYDVPYITSVTCIGLKCKITGNNFGGSFGNVDIRIGDNVFPYMQYKHFNITSRNHTNVEFYLEYFFSGDINIQFCVNDIYRSNKINYKIKPIIYSITPIPLKGNQVTINGLFLNAKTIDSRDTSIVITLGDTKCINPKNLVSGDFTSLVCDVLSRPTDKTEIPFSLKINDVPNQDTSVKFTVARILPNIDSYKFIDSNIILIGQFDYRGNLNIVFNSNGQEQIINPIFNSTTIQFTLGEDSRNGPLTAIDGFGFKSNTIQIYLKPIIDNINLDLLDPQAKIEIYGRYLSDKRFDNTSTVVSITDQYGTNMCGSITFLSSLEMICHNGIISNETKMIVTIDGISSDPKLIICPKCNPIIQSITSSHLPGGVFVGTIIGEYFAGSVDSFTLFYNNLTAKITNLTGNKIIFLYPECPIFGSNITLKYNNQGIIKQSNTYTIIDTRPSITGFTNGLPTSGGEVILYGTFFCLSNISLYFSEMYCQLITIEPTQDQMKCLMKPGSGKDKKLIILLPDVLLEPNVEYFTFTNPTISKVTFDEESTSYLTIIGQSFSFKNSVHVNITNSDDIVKPCEVIQSNFTFILCSISNFNEDTLVSMVVDVGGLTVSFSNKPVAHSISYTKVISSASSAGLALLISGFIYLGYRSKKNSQQLLRNVQTAMVVKDEHVGVYNKYNSSIRHISKMTPEMIEEDKRNSRKK